HGLVGDGCGLRRVDGVDVGLNAVPAVVVDVESVHPRRAIRLRTAQRAVRREAAVGRDDVVLLVLVVRAGLEHVVPERRDQVGDDASTLIAVERRGVQEAGATEEVAGHRARVARTGEGGATGCVDAGRELLVPCGDVRGPRAGGR